MNSEEGKAIFSLDGKQFPLRFTRRALKHNWGTIRIGAIEYSLSSYNQTLKIHAHASSGNYIKVAQSKVQLNGEREPVVFVIWQDGMLYVYFDGDLAIACQQVNENLIDNHAE